MEKDDEVPTNLVLDILGVDAETQIRDREDYLQWKAKIQKEKAIDNEKINWANMCEKYYLIALGRGLKKHDE